MRPHFTFYTVCSSQVPCLAILYNQYQVKHGRDRIYPIIIQDRGEETCMDYPTSHRVTAYLTCKTKQTLRYDGTISVGVTAFEREEFEVLYLEHVQFFQYGLPELRVHRCLARVQHLLNFDLLLCQLLQTEVLELCCDVVDDRLHVQCSAVQQGEREGPSYEASGYGAGMGSPVRKKTPFSGGKARDSKSYEGGSTNMRLSRQHVPVPGAVYCGCIM